MQANRGALAILPMISLLFAACDSTASHQTKARMGPTDTFARIEKLAFQSCMCKMARRDSRGADRALKAATSSLETAKGTETPVWPFHVLHTCYPQFGPKACLSALRVPEPYGDGAVCSPEQGGELMTAAEAAYRDHPGNREQADAAIRKRFEAMRAEAAAKIPQSACN